MLDADGHIKLVDFGLCRDDLRNYNPMEMTYCGTKEYMAPEVYNREKYNRTADWWALGALAYDMIAGMIENMVFIISSKIIFNVLSLSNSKIKLRRF